MGQAGKYLRTVGFGFGHWCPGCDEMHVIYTDRPHKNGSHWTFNGNLEAPTFSPSVRIRIPDPAPGIVECCHYFIRDGQIQFCADSTHSLAGQTVGLPEFPEDRY